MSDCLVKIVTKDPFLKLPEPILKRAQEYLESKIICIDFKWWGEAMTQASKTNLCHWIWNYPVAAKPRRLIIWNILPLCICKLCDYHNEPDLTNTDSEIEKTIKDCAKNILCTEISTIKAHI